jgi:alkylhydroperoxidase family enzyme
MARVPYLTAADAPSDTAGLIAQLPPLHVFGLMAHAETAFRPWLRFGGALLNELALDPALRELAILRVGQRCARYEWDQHVPAALRVGVPRELVDALDRGDLSPFDEPTRAALDFVDGIIDDDVDDQRYAAVAARLPEREIVELGLVAAHYLMLARMMTTFRIDPDPPADPDHLLRL